MRETWENWSGAVRATPAEIATPASRDAVVDVVERARDEGRNVRVVGSGHSFTRLVETDDVLVSLDEHQGVVDIDEDAQRATVKAGTKLHRLNDALDEHDLAMENMGDVDEQSVAGALSTGTHGTGIGFKVLADQLASVTLVDGEGEVRTYDRGDDGFGPAQVSLGALGVITEVTLDLEPAYDLRLVKSKRDVDAVLDEIEELRDGNRNFEFFWFPHTDVAVTKEINETDRDHTASVGEGGFDEVLENKAWGTLCKLSTFLPGTAKHAAGLAAAAIKDEDVVGPSHAIYTQLRDVRFNEMEYGVPAEQGPEAFRAIRELIEEDHRDVAFPVEYRYVAGDDIPLSPAHGRDTAFIAVHKYHEKEYHDYFRDCEDVFREHDGRPHWGKMHFLESATLADLYPMWDDFHAERRDSDPDGVYLNDYLAELFGEE